MRGYDFECRGVRYQVKGNRPSGKPGSPVTLVSKANNYDWDRLIWILYDRSYCLREAWQSKRNPYRARFDTETRISPADMRQGQCLYRSRYVRADTDLSSNF